MADNLRPLTLLLGAISLWALCLLIAALAGLGSRFPAAAPGAAPAALPTLSLTRSQSRLGPFANYVQVGQRPLMNANRQPAPVLAGNGEEGSNDLDVMLTSVLMTPRLQMAILTGNKDGSVRRVRVGETIEGSNWRLLQVEPRSAIVEGPGGQRTLELRVFDGRGGEMPTPLGSANSAPTVPVTGAVAPAPPAETKRPPLTDSEVAVQQQQQVEAIRRRIEERRAQMRAEAAATGANDK